MSKFSSKDFPFDLYELRDKLEKDTKSFIHHMMIVSQRNTGKTYNFIVHGFEDWIKSGEVDQIAYIRRWDSDWNGNKGARSIYNSALCNQYGENMIEKLSKGKYDCVEYQAGKYYVGKRDEESGEIRWYKDKVICYGFALNNANSIKGGNWPHIMSIALDEFLSETNYLKDEFTLIQSVLSSIIRKRTGVHCYYFGNNISFQTYPFWNDWGVREYLTKLQQGESKVFNYESGMKVSFTWLEVNSKIAKPSESDIYLGFNTGYSKMSSEGAWEIPSYEHLPYYIDIKPKDVLFEFFVDFRGELLHAEICDIDGERFTFIHKKTTPIKDTKEDCIFTTEFTESHHPNYSYGFLQKNTPVFRKIREWLRVNPIYFSDNTSGYYFYTFYDQTKDTTSKK